MHPACGRLSCTGPQRDCPWPPTGSTCPHHPPCPACSPAQPCAVAPPAAPCRTSACAARWTWTPGTWRATGRSAASGQRPAAAHLPAHPRLPAADAAAHRQALPFPLLGLVHLENRIRVLRTLGGLGPFRVSVAVEGLRPHDKGVTFSLITRLEDQLGLLWEGDSRILFRGMRLDGNAPERAESEALALEEIDHWRAPADIGRRYARVAGDYNPIHLSAPTAKLFGFPAPSPTACGTRRAPWPPSPRACPMPATKWRCASRSRCCCPPRCACWPARPPPWASSLCAARTTCRTWPAAGARCRADGRRLRGASRRSYAAPGEPHEPRRTDPTPARHP